MSENGDLPARSLDAVLRGEPTEETAALAHAVDQRIKDRIKVMRRTWIGLMGDLYEFHQGELWRDLGYAGFEAWLADPEVELERRYVYDLIAMHHQLVVERGVDPSRLQELKISKVREVLPAIRRGLVTVDEGLQDAEQLRRSDLEERYRGKSSDGVTAGPDTSTAVRTESEPEWRRCQCCGSLIRVNPGQGETE
jgi:hypothetical protein